MSTGKSLAVLFADLSGSTRLYERVGDSVALAVVERCLALFGAATEARGGRVIKTIGDEVLAVFGDVASACDAAVDMHMGLVDLPEAQEHALSMHSGVHWGDVSVTVGDVFGDTVNVAARLTATAKRGQIVVSGTVRALLGADRAAQTRHLGNEPVKGKAEPIELHELLWEPDAELTEMAHARPRARQQPRAALVLSYLGRRFELEEGVQVATIGRDPNSTIVSSDRLASRSHARIEKTGERLTFIDFSSNGSFVHVAGQEEVFVRRDSLVLRDKGTISFGRPASAEPDAVIRFEIRSAQ